MKPQLAYPVEPFHINQHFGDNLPCVINYAQPNQVIVTGADNNTCPIGYTKLYSHWFMNGHNGTDLMAGEQPVKAALDGQVVEKQDVPARGLGLGILSNVQYDFGNLGTHYLKLRYWHLKSFNVEVGQSVKTGDIIGITNNTGYSSGNHLHFEGNLVDKDAGGHPHTINLDNGYAGGINLEPYLQPFKFYFNRDLYFGMVNNDVLELQKRLGMDYSTGPGIFGPRTFLAVRAYQKANGISTTGYVGTLTRIALNASI